MSVLAISITTVALAEIGDKTQLLSLLLASRYRKPIPIIGYWTTLESYETGGIDLFDTRLMEGQEHLAASGGFWELHGLRPNTILALRASDERGESWVKSNAAD